MAIETTTTTSDSLAATPQLGLVRLSLLAVSIGIVGGVGAVVFRGLIALVHNFAFLGVISVF